MATTNRVPAFCEELSALLTKYGYTLSAWGQESFEVRRGEGPVLETLNTEMDPEGNVRVIISEE